MHTWHLSEINWWTFSEIPVVALMLAAEMEIRASRFILEFTDGGYINSFHSKSFTIILNIFCFHDHQIYYFYDNYNKFRTINICYNSFFPSHLKTKLGNNYYYYYIQRKHFFCYIKIFRVPKRFPIGAGPRIITPIAQ